jgi:hypothetical protein
LLQCASNEFTPHKFQILTPVAVDDVTFSSSNHHLLHALRVALNYNVSHICVRAVVSKQSHTLSEYLVAAWELIQSRVKRIRASTLGAKCETELANLGMLVTSLGIMQNVFLVCVPAAASADRLAVCTSAIVSRPARGVPLS